MTELLCERHDELCEKVKTIDGRVSALELSDSEQKNELKHLIRKLDRLSDKLDKYVARMNTVIMSVAVGGVAFIIWYIQDLPH